MAEKLCRNQRCTAQTRARAEAGVTHVRWVLPSAFWPARQSSQEMPQTRRSGLYQFPQDLHTLLSWQSGLPVTMLFPPNYRALLCQPRALWGSPVTQFQRTAHMKRWLTRNSFC